MIEVKNLTKRYGANAAVDNITFTVNEGEIVGFLGPNGAGKSTTMNILTGYLSATSGTAVIGGFDVLENPNEAKKQIGYLPELPPLYLDMTVEEYLNFMFELKKVDLPRKEHIEEICKLVKISNVYTRLIRNLSKGYRQRVGIAQALLGNPKVLILDEPTVGLDPRQITEIRELIQNLGRDHTVILSSHILSEVQAVCQTVLIISKGRLVACDETADLEKHFAGKPALELTVEATREEVGGILDRIGGVTGFAVEDDGNYVNLKVETDLAPDDMCRKLFFAFSDLGRPILRMTTTQASLEEIFLELTQEEKGEQAK